MDLFSNAALLALGQVLMINIILSGDNAVVIGMVAARVAEAEQRKVVLWGMAAAVVLRVLLALVAVDLLQILGLTLAGGIILVWVAWRLYRDIREAAEEREGTETVAEQMDPEAPRAQHPPHASLPLRQAIIRIAIADISMSVDNVLAIAGAANDNIPVLVIGLVVSKIGRAHV